MDIIKKTKIIVTISKILHAEASLAKVEAKEGLE